MPRKPKPSTFAGERSSTHKTLILKLVGDRESRVLVPVTSKVTFGPALPGPQRGFGERVSEYAVRVYDGPTEKSGLLAVFTGVREFRIDSIRVDALVIRESGKTIWKNDEEGLEINHAVRKERKLLREEF